MENKNKTKIKFYKPYTSSIRFKKLINFFKLIKKKPEKNLILNIQKKFGRNNQGKITTRHLGGSHKKLYRSINFKKKKFNLIGKIISIEYDPYRTAFISLIYYEDNSQEYMLHVEGLKIGDYIFNLKDKISSKFYKKLKKFHVNRLGSTLPIKYIPRGCYIHNLEIYPKKGAQILRSAGSFGIINAIQQYFIAIKLASREIKLFHPNCLATIGKLSNSGNHLIKSGKAGRSRWLGIRPTVRGSAMNPIDHPHGGGEGKSPIGRKAPLTPWGKKTLGVKTRKKKKDKLILKKRNKKKK